MYFHRKVIVFLVMLLFGFTFQVYAQFGIGPRLVISVPQDALAEVSKTGEGLGLKFLYELPWASFFSLRGDLVYVSYSATPGGYGYYMTSERNESFRLVAGAQLAVPIGRFTLYAAATGGIYNFRTVWAVTDYYYGYSESRGKTKPGWNVGGGVLVDIGLGPSIDLELQYHTISDIIDAEVNGVAGEIDGNDISVNIGVVFFLNK